MCGASDEQKQMYAAQHDFFQQLTEHYGTVFGKQQAILDSLTGAFKPILEAGPNQRGFSDAERHTLETQATESTARGYAHAKEALGQELAARGGDTYIPSGADDQLSGELMSTAEAERANLNQKITMADFDTGRRNWTEAADVLGGVAAQENPTGVSNSAINAGNSAADTADKISEADNSIWSVVGGALGGVAGQMAGGWATGASTPRGH